MPSETASLHALGTASLHAFGRRLSESAPPPHLSRFASSMLVMSTISLFVLKRRRHLAVRQPVPQQRRGPLAQRPAKTPRRPAPGRPKGPPERPPQSPSPWWRAPAAPTTTPGCPQGQSSNAPSLGVKQQVRRRLQRRQRPCRHLRQAVKRARAPTPPPLAVVHHHRQAPAAPPPPATAPPPGAAPQGGAPRTPAGGRPMFAYPGGLKLSGHQQPRPRPVRQRAGAEGAPATPSRRPAG